MDKRTICFTMATADQASGSTFKIVKQYTYLDFSFSGLYLTKYVIDYTLEQITWGLN